MLLQGLNILRKWLPVLLYLTGAMLLFLMGSLVILSFLLAVFIVAIKENVGKMLIKVRVSGYFSMQKVKGIWYRLARNLKFLN
jgi:hypothetical protein